MADGHLHSAAGRRPGIGFFLWPAYWIGATPDVRNATAADLTEKVIRAPFPFGEISASRDGLLMYYLQPPEFHPSEDVSFEEQTLVNIRRLQVMNVHLLCLSSTWHLSPGGSPPLTYTQVVGVADLIRERPRDQLPTEVYASDWVKRSGDPAEYTHKSDLTNRFEISLEHFSASVDLLGQVIAQGALLMRSAELYQQAAAAWQNLDFPFSVVTAWTAIETLLGETWNDYLAKNRSRGNRTFINAERLRSLNSRDYPASVTTEVLSLLEVIPQDLYEGLTKARRARNKAVHDAADLPYTVATETLQSLRDLIEHRTGIRLQWMGAPRIGGESRRSQHDPRPGVYDAVAPGPSATATAARADRRSGQ